MDKRTTRTVALLAALVLTGAVLAGCASDDETSTDTTADATGTTDAPDTAPDTRPPSTDADPTTTDAPAEQRAVEVWFARGEQLAVGGADAQPPAVAEDAILSLLAGPDELERDLGMHSEIPEGTELLGVDIDGGVATVDLSGTFESGGGSLSMRMRVAQVVSTLTQFDTVESVDIRLDGRDVEAIGGEGVPARGLSRDDVRDLTPLVVITSPLPGEAVSSPVTITGISNTFEATVQWSVVDPEGLILDEGFTTATAGNGTWGTFAVDVPYSYAGRAGLGAVVAWQSDASGRSPDGRTDVYEVPVSMGG